MKTRNVIITNLLCRAVMPLFIYLFIYLIIICSAKNFCFESEVNVSTLERQTL